jgi:hypothetical protein
LLCLALGVAGVACKSDGSDFELTDYEFATGTFTFEVESEMNATYDLSALAGALQGVGGAEQLAAAGPTTTSSKVRGVAEVVIEADGDDRRTTVTFAEASGEMAGAFGTSEITADDIGTAEFVSAPDGEVTSGRGGRTAGLPSLDIGRAFNCPPLPDGGVDGATSWQTEVTLDVAGGSEVTVPMSGTFSEGENSGEGIATVEGRLAGPAETNIDSSLLTAQLQIPGGAETSGVELDVLVEMDVTVACTLGVPDKELRSRTVEGAMVLTFALPPEVFGTPEAGAATLFDGLRVENVESTHWQEVATD